jgi:transposase
MPPHAPNVDQQQSHEGQRKGFRHLSRDEKVQILTLLGQGFSGRKIAAVIGHDVTTVCRLAKKWKTSQSLDRTIGSGRPRITSAVDDRALIHHVQNDRFASATDLQKLSVFEKLSLRTIRRRITESGEFNSYWAAHKPFISESNRVKRLKWCKDRIGWPVERWLNVLWTDESPFVLRFNRKKRVWRRANERYAIECVKGSIKHDKKINVWGAFAAHGVGSLIMVDGILEQIQYRDILDTYMLPSKDVLFGDGDWLFQQDNDPKHTAILTRDWFIANNVPLMEWPSQSPDLNPIENLWTILDLSCKDRNPQNEQELFEILEQAWHQLNPDTLYKLVASMPRRCADVIANNGYPCKY